MKLQLAKRGSNDPNAVCHVCLLKGHCAGFVGSVYVDCPNKPVGGTCACVGWNRPLLSGLETCGYISRLRLLFHSTVLALVRGMHWLCVFDSYLQTTTVVSLRRVTVGGISRALACLSSPAH